MHSAYEYLIGYASLVTQNCNEVAVALGTINWTSEYIQCTIHSLFGLMTSRDAPIVKQMDHRGVQDGRRG